MAEMSSPLPDAVLQRLPQLKEMEGALRCEICYEFLKTSVITSCSHNFCSVCIRHCLTYRQTCPSCSSVISESDLRPNRTLDCIIEHFAAMRKAVLKVFEERNAHRNVCIEFDRLLTASEKPENHQPDCGPSQSCKTPITQPLQSSHYFMNSVQQDSSNGKASNSNSPGIQSSCSSSLSKRKLSKSCLEEVDDIVCLGSPNKISCDPCKTPKKSTSKNLFSALDSINDGVSYSPAKKVNVLDYFSPKKSNSSNGNSTRAAFSTTITTTSGSISSSSTCVSSSNIGTNVSSSASSSGVRTVLCPVCGASVPELNINFHLDSCAESETAPPKPTLTRPPQPKRSHLPKLVYHLLSDSKLRSELKKVGLSTNGSREALIKRHKNYVVVYNSECDKVSPRPVKDLLRQVERAEVQQPTVLSRPPSVFSYHSKSSPSVIEEGQLKIQKKYKTEFSALLADLKRRRKQEKKIPKGTTTSCSQSTEHPRDAPASTSQGSSNSTVTTIASDAVTSVHGGGISQGTKTSRFTAADASPDEAYGVSPRRAETAGAQASKPGGSEEILCTPRRSKLSIKRKISVDSTNDVDFQHSQETVIWTSPVLASKSDQSVVEPIETGNVRQKNVLLDSSSPRHEDELFAEYDDDDLPLDEIIEQETKLMAEMSSCSKYSTAKPTQVKTAQQHNKQSEQILQNATSLICNESPLKATRKCRKLPVSAGSNLGNSIRLDVAVQDDDDMPFFEAQESASKQLQSLVNCAQHTNLNGTISSSDDSRPHGADMPLQNRVPVLDERHQINGETSQGSESSRSTTEHENSACVSPDLFGGGDEVEDDGDASSNCSFSLLDDRPQQLKDVGIGEDPLTSLTLVKEVASDDEADQIPASQRRLRGDKNNAPDFLANSLQVAEVQQVSNADTFDETLVLNGKSCDSTQVFDSSEEFCVKRKHGKVGAMSLDSAAFESQSVLTSPVECSSSESCGTSCEILPVDCTENSEVEGCVRQLRSTRQQQKETRSSPKRRCSRRPPARSAAPAHKVSCPTESLGTLDSSTSKKCAVASGSTGRKRKSSEMTAGTNQTSVAQGEAVKRRSTRLRK